MGLEEDGNAHGVLLLNSNAMGKRKKPKPTLFSQHVLLQRLICASLRPLWPPCAASVFQMSPCSPRLL